MSDNLLWYMMGRSGSNNNTTVITQGGSASGGVSDSWSSGSSPRVTTESEGTDIISAMLKVAMYVLIICLIFFGVRLIFFGGGPSETKQRTKYKL